MFGEYKRLTASQVSLVRARLAGEQGGKCAICGGAFGSKAPHDPVLDHDHATGAVRGVLHRGCNSGLGVVENGAKRFGFMSRIIQFCMGLGAYLRKHEENVTGYIHPTHKTEDEKRLLRNKRARVARAKKKESV